MSAEAALEYALFAVWAAMTVICPWTKVEESFSVQAVHDLLYHGSNTSEYDHLEFPGVVPRSWAGPLAVAALALVPFHFVEAFGFPKYLVLQAGRLALGFYVWLGFRSLSLAVGSAFGTRTRRWVLLLSLVQFHGSFYATRPLPNTFALVLVLFAMAQWLRDELRAAVFTATIAVAVFRCELVLLFGPIFLPSLLRRRLPFTHAIVIGLIALALSLVITVPLDSYFWGRWLWPEGEVWWFNVVRNKSHQWGSMPLLWYFYSALPRAIGFALPLALIAPLLEPKTRPVVAPAVTFVCLYSFLPHKELRFIIYAFPLLNISAASVLANMWERGGSPLRRLTFRLSALGVLGFSAGTTLFFLQAARWNYPGGAALLHLHSVAPQGFAMAVHVDDFCAQSGVSRFLHLHPAWRYDKTDNATVAEKAAFDYVLVGAEQLRAALLPFQKSFHLVHKEPAFAGLKLPSPLWRFWDLRLKYQDKVAILMSNALN